MAKYIKHRVNSIADLSQLPEIFGAEIDLRLRQNGDVYVAHDVDQEGPLLSEWISGYRHSTLVLNVKSDGLESDICELLQKHGISDYFFLDQPFPTFLKSIKQKIICAVRVSEFEVIPKNLENELRWIWADSFTGDWSHLLPTLDFVKEQNLNICLVSPELQGRFSSDEITEIKNVLQSNNYFQEVSICTKFPELWESEPIK